MDVLTLMAGRELEIKVKSERAVFGAWTWALLARFLALVQGTAGAGWEPGCSQAGAALPHLVRESWVTRESSTDPAQRAKEPRAASPANHHQLTGAFRQASLPPCPVSRRSWVVHNSGETWGSLSCQGP